MANLLFFLHVKRKKIKKNLDWYKLVKMPIGEKAFIIGSPDYSNLGDSAILLAQILFLEKCGFSQKRIKEITADEFYKNREKFKTLISNHQLICGMGGGNMGNQWPTEEKIRYDVLDDFTNNPVIIFPQTLYFLPNSELDEQKSVSYYDGHEGLTIVARERKSYERMKCLYGNTDIELTPDMVLFSTMDDYGVKETERNGIVFCVRNDAEKKVDDSVWNTLKDVAKNHGKNIRVTDMYADCTVTKENRADCVQKKMQEFCSAELVITDRLHGMIFSALTGTPCIVFSNYNHKVKGTYDWISYLPYIRYVETKGDAIKQIPELLTMKNCHYDNMPLMPYFDSLKRVIKAKCR